MEEYEEYTVDDLRRALSKIGRLTKAIERNDTLLKITGIMHDENVWSKIYAYFLDANKPHGLETLFLDCLAQLVFEKTGRQMRLSGSRIYTELSTDKGNRIDILIQNDAHSVIIENKVYHVLNNDLDDYWYSVKGKDDDKIGIVLSLTHLHINNPHYINITHREWMKRVESQLPQDKIDLRTKILLTDFINTVNTLSRFCCDMENSRFYLENRTSINILYDVAFHTKNYLQNIFTDKNFINGLGAGFTLVHNDRIGCKHRYAMYKFPDTDELVITVFYEPMWKSEIGESYLSLYLEPVGKWYKKVLDHKTKIKEIARNAGVAHTHEPDDKVHYWHCACVKINFTEEQILDEKYIKDALAVHLRDKSSGIMRAAYEIRQLLSNPSKPTFCWEDVILFLKRNWPEDAPDDVSWFIESISFISFDRKNLVLVLEIENNMTRSVIEQRYYDFLRRAVNYAFGENVRISFIL